MVAIGAIADISGFWPAVGRSLMTQLAVPVDGKEVDPEDPSAARNRSTIVIVYYRCVDGV
jgi:hypothetical protein